MLDLGVISPSEPGRTGPKARHGGLEKIREWDKKQERRAEGIVYAYERTFFEAKRGEAKSRVNINNNDDRSR